MEVQLAPPSMLLSMFTVSALPRFWFQVMARVVPTAQLTAVLGAVMVTTGLAMVKLTALWPRIDASAVQLTRILDVVDAGPLTAQL